MANPWLRLWTDMPNDPKWRTIARISKQEISRVISIYVHMMICASNATERGRTEGWCDEDIATALDIDESDVLAVREAMQGRVLDGDYLTGWEKRQPIKEDGSAERSKAWREAQKELKQTLPNATERKQTLDKIREDKNIKTKPKRDATAFARFWDAYPKKVGKGKAEKAFVKVDVALLDVILKAVAQHSKSEQWLKDNGQFIPHPATWLNERRWEDEMQIAASYKPIIPFFKAEEIVRGPKPEGIGSLKSLVKQRDSP
jgi:hypothetical protein